MSYLDGPRLCFTGRFRCDVPTANNTLEGTDPLWNPGGSAAFDLLGCTVTGGESAPGAPIVAGDPDHGLAVVGAGDRPSAKLVDLDPDWQQSSQIWGLTVRLVVAGTGEELLAGEFRPAAFRDPWTRQPGGQENDQPAGASFTSVLDEVRFGPRCAEFPALDALRGATTDARLSIVLNTFAAYYQHVADRFATGVLTGVIGPWRPGEPFGFVAGRRLRPGRFPVAAGQPPRMLGPAVASVDAPAGRLVVDLGNAYPVDDPDGRPTVPAAPVQALEVGLLPGEATLAGTTLPAGAATVLGTVAVDALPAHAGIVAVPLDAAALAAVAIRPLALLGRLPDGRRRVLTREVTDGRYVRIDEFVHRIEAGGSTTATVHVRDRGRPVPATAFLQVDEGSVLALPDADPVSSGICSVTTGEDGTATVRIEAGDPGNPRGDVDGVVALVGYAPRLADGGGLDPAATDLIVTHVRDAYTAPDRPDWTRDIQPVLARYSRLYPVMGHHLADLGNLEAIRPYRAAMLLALSRDIGDPNHMPVTRDLSAGKREAIVRWLEQLAPAATGMARAPGAGAALPLPAPTPVVHDVKTALGLAAADRVDG